MTVNSLKLDPNFFSKVAFRKETLKAIDLDNQFNGIAHYINNTLLPVINQLIIEVMPGILGNANSYLKNVGDGTTTWAPITSENSIYKYSLPLEVFKKTPPGSVIVAGPTGILQIVTPTENNTCLISTENSGPKWQKLTGANIENQEITSDKIAEKSIEKHNLDSTSLAWLFDTTLTSEKLVKNAIDNSRLANEAISFNLIDKQLQNTLFTAYPTISGIMLGNEILTLTTKEHYELYFNRSASNPGLVPLKAYQFKDSINPFALDVKPFTIEDLDYPKKNPFDSFSDKTIGEPAIYGYHIADNTINGERIRGKIDLQIEFDTLDIDCFPVEYKTKLGL